MTHEGFVSFLRELIEKYEDDTISQEKVIESARKLKDELLPENSVLKIYLDDVFGEYDKNGDETFMMSELITTVQ